MQIRVKPGTKVECIGYRRARVVPLFTETADTRNQAEIDELDALHDELVERSGGYKDNHQSFILDGKIIIRFDDWTILVGNAADAEIKDYGWW